MPRTPSWTFVLALVMVTSSVASAIAQDPPLRAADPEVPPRVEDSPSAHVWYGWQTLLVDGAGIATIAASVAVDSPGLLIAGGGVWLAGSPIVHFVHGRVGQGLGSLALRAVSFAAVGIGFALITPHFFERDEPGEDALVIAGFTGMVASTVIDATLLSFMVRRRHGSSISLLSAAPWLDARRRCAGIRVNIEL